LKEIIFWRFRYYHLKHKSNSTKIGPGKLYKFLSKRKKALIPDGILLPMTNLILCPGLFFCWHRI